MSKPPRLRKRLSNMHITEVSLVDHPANDDARTEIIKRATPPEPEEAFMPGEYDYEDTKLLDGDQEFDGEDGDGDEVVLLIPTDDGFLEVTADDLADVTDAIDDIDAAAEAEPEDDGIQKMRVLAGLASLALVGTRVAHEALASAADEIRKRDETIEAQEVEIQKRGGEPIAKRAPVVDVTQLDPQLRAQLQAGQVALEEVAKRQVADEITGYVEFARGLGIGDAKVVGSMLWRIAKGRSGPNDAELVAELLSNGGRVEKNRELLATLGDGGQSSGAEARVSAMANELVQKSGGNLTPEQVRAEIWARHPDLYRQFLAERAG